MDNETQMSEFLERGQELLAKIDEKNEHGNELLAKIDKKHERDLITQELHEAQLNHYKGLISDSINLAERRWNGLRQFVVAIVCVIVASVISGGAILNSKASKNEVEDKLKSYAREDEVRRGLGSVTESVFYNFEATGTMTHVEAENAKDEARKSLLEEFDYNPRNVK